MKPRLVDEPPTAGDWSYELKFDGIRACAVKDGSKVSLISRNGNELRSRFPEIADAMKKLSIGECVIDGEVVALDEEGPLVISTFAGARDGRPKSAGLLLRFRFASA